MSNRLVGTATEFDAFMRMQYLLSDTIYYCNTTNQAAYMSMLGLYHSLVCHKSFSRRVPVCISLNLMCTLRHTTDMKEVYNTTPHTHTRTDTQCSLP